jgi:outer membrane protein OmpA-like peptidoglycan-associated protein
MEEDFAEMDIEKANEAEKDSLRSIIAANYNPIELTNYVKLIDILDPNGTRIGKEILGEKSVATIQARDEVRTKFNDNVIKADQYFYNDNLPEARASYFVANVIDDDEAYPVQQLRIIEEKMEDAPFEAFLATLPEQDESEFVVLEDPTLSDNSAMIIPEDKPMPSMPQEVTPETPVEVAAAQREGIDGMTPASQAELQAQAGSREIPTAPGIAEKVVTPETVAQTEQPVINTPDEADEKVETVETLETVEPVETVEPDETVEAVETVAKDTEMPMQFTETPTAVEPTVTPQTPQEKAIAAVPAPKPEAKPAIKETPATPSQAAPGEEETIVFRNILFDFDRSFLRDESVKELNKVSNYMSVKNEVELRIDGHADWIGSEEYNMSLSERRAKTAYDYLVDKGIADQRLTYQFFGESVPIAPNTNQDGSDNPEGRQLNRRCELKLDKSGTAQNVVLKF